MNINNIQTYKILANKIRINSLNMIYSAKCAHIGSCLSIADLLAVLYGGVLRIDATHPDYADRDRFILSKGHAAAALYAVLAERGFFPKKWLETYYKDGSCLGGHVTFGVPGVDISTGSLGHGLPIGCGIALAAHMDKRNYRTFVLLGDGECDEGSIWEAALFAPHHHLDNLVVIIDYNKIQSFGLVQGVLDLNPFAEKWRAFGWITKEINGHDLGQIEDTLKNIPFKSNNPSCIIAHTIKGKGVSFMENDLAWHYRPPNDEQFRRALLELGVPK